MHACLRNRWRGVWRVTLSAVCGGLIFLTPPASSIAQESARDSIRRAREPVAGRYVVKLKNTADADAVALETAGAYRGRLRHVYRHAVQGFTLDLSEAAARSLARDPRVDVVEEDSIVRPAAVQLDPPSWGLDRIDQRALPLDHRYAYVTPLAAVNVYVIDSGIRLSHIEFEGRAFIGGDFVDDDGDNDPHDIDSDDGDPSTPDGVDCHGHGTQMAGTIAGGTVGVAKGATLWALRVLGCDGAGSWSGVIAAIDAVTAEARRPAVVNLSLTGNPNSVADDAIRRSIAGGITYVVAAGNAGEDAANYSPSRVSAALVVGSTAPDDRRSSFSNWGSSVDLFAPGEAIVTAANDGDTEFLAASGTSAATAHVAGVAALYLGANQAALPGTVHAAVLAAATKGVVSDAGAGSPNDLLYSGFFQAEATISVTHPNRSSVNWGVGSRQPIAWTHSLPAGAFVRVLLSRDGGRTYAPIANQVRNASATSGEIAWIVTGPNTRDALVRVESVDGANADVSNSTFVIADPYVRLTAPHGGERWTAGQRVAVRWAHNLGPADEVTIALSKNGGVRYPWVISPRTQSDGVHSVLVEPRWSTSRARLRINWLLRPAIGDASEEAFTILPR